MKEEGKISAKAEARLGLISLCKRVNYTIIT